MTREKDENGSEWFTEERQKEFREVADGLEAMVNGMIADSPELERRLTKAGMLRQKESDE